MSMTKYSNRPKTNLNELRAHQRKVANQATLNKRIRCSKKGTDYAYTNVCWNSTMSFGTNVQLQ